MRLFITATGTGVGKTYVTAALVQAALARGITVRAIKPLLSGYDPADQTNDAALLLAAQGLGPGALDTVCPWRYAAPLSPDMAAHLEGKTVPVAEVIAFTKAVLHGPEGLVLVEGVGGAFVPLSPAHTVADWVAAAAIPPVLVAGSYLGTLSHTISCVRAMALAGIAPLAVVVSESAGDHPSFDATCTSLAAHLPQTNVLPLRQGDEGVALLAALKAATSAR